MFHSAFFPTLLAQATTETQYRIVMILAIVGAILILPFMIGNYIAKSLRAADYGWKIGLILCTVISATAIVYFGELKLGVDLRGGVILIYELEDEQESTGDADSQGMTRTRSAKDLVQPLTNRINPSGTKEIVIRPYGDRQIEIIIPEIDPIEVEQIKKILRSAGALEFRIVATRRRQHEQTVTKALEQSKDPFKKTARLIRDERGDQVIAYWARVAKVSTNEKAVNEFGVPQFKVSVFGDIIRDSDTGDLIDLPTTEKFDDKTNTVAAYLAKQNIENVDILMMADDGYDVKGDDLSVISSGFDETLNPQVNFGFKSTGAPLMRGLTASNLPDPDTNTNWRLGIVLDNSLISAPVIQSTISDRGRITGRFTKEEVDFLVSILRAGELPASLKHDPISENQIGAMLGEETIRRGTMSIGMSLGAVLLFILIYYRFSGMVASLALGTNLLLILGLMMLMKAPLTLPGLAGLVLTIGMSVDANVLIFERIREELARGSALRMSIRNGFGRATTTIVDANLTTLMVALVLYAIGTDQIRGFAVTLILGILMSMYTAIFCSRVIFDLAERRRWITSLGMMKIMGATQIDFIGKRKLAAALSIILIAVGLVGVIGRKQGIFDIDFTGGSSATMFLTSPMSNVDVRKKLDAAFAEEKVDTESVQYTLNRVDVENSAKDTYWKVDSSIKVVERLQKLLNESFELAKYEVEVKDVKQVAMTAPVTQSESPPASDEPADPPPASNDESDPPKDSPTDDPPSSDAPKTPATKESDAPSNDTPETDETSRRSDLPSDTVFAFADETPKSADDAEANSADKDDDSEPAPKDPSEPAPAKDAAAEKSDDESPSKPAEDPESKTPPSDEPKPATDSNPKDDTTEPSETDPVESPKDSEKTDEPEPTTTEPAPGTEPSDETKETETTEPSETGETETEPQVRTSARTIVELSFQENPIAANALEQEIKDAAMAVGLSEPQVEVSSPDAEPADAKNKKYTTWNVTIGTDEATTKNILTNMEEKFGTTPIWPSSSKIGSKVAGDTKTQAVAALLTSLLGIIGYIWFRFQRVIFGLAAVVALVHDVLITLGAIAVSYWLAGSLSFLLIEEFKISLPVVAAFLTIIGYSLNDTIVVFDRIREVRGKSPELTGEMINTSINQTLSRTLLTSMTTLLVVLILYSVGGQGIHGFAFALVIGVLVGTYSSIFVASPALLWMTGASQSQKSNSTTV